MGYKTHSAQMCWKKEKGCSIVACLLQKIIPFSIHTAHISMVIGMSLFFNWMRVFFLAFISVKKLHVKNTQPLKMLWMEFCCWNEWDLLNGTMDRKTQNQKIVLCLFFLSMNLYLYICSMNYYRDAVYAWSYIEYSYEIIEMLSHW